MDYKKLIQDNQSQFNDAKNLIDFIDNYINEDEDNISDLEDNISEHADGQVPIYYYEIVKEWQENGDCHEMTIEVVGEYNQKDGIYAMMTSDLFFYYEQQLREDYDKFLELLNDDDERTDEEIEDDNREDIDTRQKS